MEKTFKELYSFTVDKEVEKEVSTTKKNKQGEEVTVTKKDRKSVV